MDRENGSRIILAMKDSSYLKEVEWDLFFRLGNSAALQSITEQEYFERAYQEKKEDSILVIDKVFYELLPEKELKNCVFCVKEEGAEKNPKFPEYIKQVTKKELTKELFRIIGSGFQKSKSSFDTDKTQGILCYSPIGGCGKTVVALAMAERLSSDGYQVLYVNAENIQNFQFYLDSRAAMPAEDLLNYILNRENNLYLKQKDIGHEQFDYLLPLDGIIPAMGIEGKAYADFMERLLSSRMYDYIIFDISADLNETGMRLMEKCSRVLTVMGQSEEDLYKIKCFLDNMDYDNQKFVFVSNTYKDNIKENGTPAELEKKAVITIPKINHAKGKELVQEIAVQIDWKGIIG